MSYNNGGGIVSGSRARYLPFGAYRTAPTQTFTDRGYTGQKHNDDLGLIYYNARYYLSAVGRFVSADTIVPDAGNPQSFNRYSYGYNSPIVYSDPTGHLSIAEIENYFGYTTEQQMIDAYGQAVAKQLWNTKFTWGDVLKYDCAECIDGKGYVMLVLKGNQSDEFRGAFWGLEAIHNGHDFRGKEVSAGFLHQATDASLDLAWTAAYENWSQLPVDYEAYGASRDGMVAGTWHDYAFWRPAIWLGSLMAPVGLIPAAFSEGWGVLEEITDDILDIGHPLGKYHTAYPTIKFANRWGYLPTANTYSFLAPRSVHR